MAVTGKEAVTLEQLKSLSGLGGGGISEIPIATEDTLGGVKVGENVSVDETGVLTAQTATLEEFKEYMGGSVNEDGSVSSYELPIASSTTLGGVKIGEGISVTEDGTISSSGGDLSGSVDNKTIEYSIKEGEPSKTLHVKEDGIESKHLALKAAYENLQNASSSDFGKVKLSDSEDTSLSASDSVAATPSAVRKIIDHPRESRVTAESTRGVASITPINILQNAVIEGELFTKSSDSRLTVNEPCLSLISYYSQGETALKINGEKQKTESNKTVVLLVSLESGDYIEISGSGSYPMGTSSRVDNLFVGGL